MPSRSTDYLFDVVVYLTMQNQDELQRTGADRHQKESKCGVGFWQIGFRRQENELPILHRRMDGDTG